MAGVGGADDQHERSGYMRQIVGTPRGQMEQLFLVNDAQVMRAMFAGVPESSVDEYVDVLGTPEGMRGVLDWYRAGALKLPGSGDPCGKTFGSVRAGVKTSSAAVTIVFFWETSRPRLAVTQTSHRVPSSTATSRSCPRGGRASGIAGAR